MNSPQELTTDQQETAHLNHTNTYTKHDLYKAINAMAKEGSIDANTAKHLRDELGFTKSMFTKQPKNSSKRKAKNKMAKKSRKANRGK